MGLEQLIYVSTATRELDAPELDLILASSARNNPGWAITGMLLYSRGTFMQVLEGEAAAVDALMAILGKDPRHHHLLVLERCAIPARAFARWTMGFRRLGADDSRRAPAWAPLFERGFDAEALGVQPGVALAMLRDFARLDVGLPG